MLIESVMDESSYRADPEEAPLLRTWSSGVTKVTSRHTLVLRAPSTLLDAIGLHSTETLSLFQGYHSHDPLPFSSSRNLTILLYASMSCIYNTPMIILYTMLTTYSVPDLAAFPNSFFLFCVIDVLMSLLLHRLYHHFM